MKTLSIITLLLPLLITATPVPAPQPAAVATTSFADFPVNVIMIAGAAQVGMWVPRDGIWRSTSTIDCLNAGANSHGSCIYLSYDRVGVVAGNGPCSFVGATGFRTTLTGRTGEGFAAIAPPQTLTWVMCGSPNATASK